MGRANIKDDGVKFSSENQPKNRRSRKGVPNRATVYKRLLEIKTKLPHPADATQELDVTLYEAAALGQILAAQHGNAQSWKEIQDSLHGKQADKITGDDGGPITFKVVYDK